MDENCEACKYRQPAPCVLQTDGNGMSDLLNKPIVLFLLGALLAFSGSYVTGQQSASSLTVRVATLEERAKQPVVTPAELARVEAAARDAQRTYVTKDEFQQFSSSMLRGIEELRIELRERRTR